MNFKKNALRTEIVDETDVVALHNNASRNKNTPCNSLGIQPKTLQQGHVAFLLGGRTGIVNDRRVRLEGVIMLLPIERIAGLDGIDTVCSHC